MKNFLGNVLFVATFVGSILAHELPFLAGMAIAAFVLALLHRPYIATSFALVLVFCLVSRYIWEKVRI